MNYWNQGRLEYLRFVLLAALSVSAYAERLPLRTYTTADGLPSAYIQRIVRDSRGFLWFCTRDGLSRFDGSRFVTYSMQHGLPHPNVNHLLETRKGDYWVATNGGGVCRFDPRGIREPERGAAAKPPGSRTLFTAFRVGDHPLTNRVNVLYQDRRERLWAGTDDGLFRLHEGNGRSEFHPFALAPDAKAPVTSFAEDAEGNLWVGTYSGVTKIGPNDQIVEPPYKKTSRVNELLFDRQGNMWVAYDWDGLMVFPPKGGWYRYTARDGLPGNQITGLRHSTDGRIWIAGEGLAEFDGRRFRTYTKEQGVPWVRRGGLAQDRDGNLWLVTLTGAVKLVLNGFTTYGVADGLGRGPISSIFEDLNGVLVATGYGDSAVFISRFDGKRFHSVQPKLPSDARPVWPVQGVLLDRSGQWWLMTDKGLWRFHASTNRQLVQSEPSAVYDRRRGLTHERVSCAYEDRRGDLWIGSMSGEKGGLTRWERGRDLFRTYSEADGLPKPPNTPTAFSEDGSGRLWVGFQFGGLAHRDGDRFRLFTAADGLGEGSVTALHLDQRGRLWIATNQNGVTRAEDLTADRPRFLKYTVSESLSSNNARCIAEDRWGRIYVGTARGVDRLDPRTGHVQRYTVSDGLNGDFITAAFRDRHGALWFGTLHGLSRLAPRPEERAQLPPIWIGGVRVAGVSYPVSEIGDREIPRLDLDANANTLQIDFFSLSFGAGEALRYQFMLGGADKDWSAPADVRTVHYASLSPGSYRFQVRAVSADGARSASPAVVSFTIHPPFWQRSWFLTAIFLVAMSILYALHHLRVTRLLEVEHLRRRIAADLHDDIGASLSRVAILSEVVKQQIGPEQLQPNRRLSEIAETVRGLVDAMSDIVWSVDPRLDDLHSVTVRIREFAADVLAGNSIAWAFQASTGFEKVRLHPEQRRHLFLIFKEALTNIARHSGSRSASLTLLVDSRVIRAEIQDDGCGFAQASADGHGLENMRSRVAQLGGEIRFESVEGGGARIILNVPLRRAAPRKESRA